MKRLAFAFVLLASLMIPSTSHAEWVKIAENVNGDSYYIDRKIRRHGGHIYYWQLTDNLKPRMMGSLSAKFYVEADCKKFGRLQLQALYHTQQMGKGKPLEGIGPVDEPWEYPAPVTAGEDVLEAACEMAK